MTWGGHILVAYLVGAIPFGVIIGWGRGVNVRARGSRNIGATNVGRLLGRPLGLLCFVLDLAKGALPMMGAGLAHGLYDRGLDGGTLFDAPHPETGWWVLLAVAAVLGHVYSPFLGFRGGKGVATAFGAMVVAWPWLTLPALAAGVVWVVALGIFRYVSVASIAAAVAIPVGVLVELVLSTPAMAVRGPVLQQVAGPLGGAMLLAALISWRHRENIGRLRRGEEPRAGSPGT